MRRPTNVLLVAGLCALVHACGHETGSGNAAPDGVIYEAMATDEALVALLATARKTGSAPVTITAPTADQLLPRGTPMTFNWSGGLSAAAAPGHVPLTAPVASLPRRALAALVETFRVRPAYAHGPPFNGQAYYLRVIANNAEILRVFTAARTYTPDATAWQRLTNAGGELRATLLSAFFEKNSITADGGPVEATPVRFRIGP
jgi:hypothetical protein